MDAVERKRDRETEHAIGTSEDLSVIREKRRRVEDLLPAFVVDTDVVKER